MITKHTAIVIDRGLDFEKLLNFPVYYKMPCGAVVQFAEVKDVPLVTTPCTCGDPMHWIIEWREPKAEK